MISGFGPAYPPLPPNAPKSCNDEERWRIFTSLNCLCRVGKFEHRGNSIYYELDRSVCGIHMELAKNE